jgi:hypothetical protein
LIYTNKNKYYTPALKVIPLYANDTLYRYCLAEQITFTRSRPYRKNDQAHVEHWSVVRHTAIITAGKPQKSWRYWSTSMLTCGYMLTTSSLCSSWLIKRGFVTHVEMAGRSCYNCGHEISHLD